MEIDFQGHLAITKQVIQHESNGFLSGANRFLHIKPQCYALNYFEGSHDRETESDRKVILKVVLRFKDHETSCST